MGYRWRTALSLSPFEPPQFLEPDRRAVSCSAAAAFWPAVCTVGVTTLRQRQRDMTHVNPREPADTDFAGNPPSASATTRLRRSQGMKGKTASLRRTIRLAPGYQLHKGPSGSEHRLVSPKGSIPLNDSAAGILEMCDGKHTAEEIVARVLRTRDDSLADDVRAFLDAAARRGWIVEG